MSAWMKTFGARPFSSNGASSRSLGVPSAVYPAAVATNSDLIVAVDLQQTRLALPMGAADTTMTVTNGPAITAYNLLTIDLEIVKTAGPPTGNVVPVQRGFDGTTPAAHLSGAAVSGFIDAYHHNRLAAEIEAIETTLGANLSRIPGSVFAANDAYIFPPQTPGGNLIVGANVVTLTPVPAGVNGTDSNHYLYISGGTGTPEAALIQGGTAVAGAASGTVIVQCANTHSGAWTIQTATNGMQEAAIAAGAGGRVIVHKGGTVYAPTTLSLPATIQGTPGNVITASGSPASVFNIAADNCEILDCSIAAGTAQYAITNTGAHNGIVVAQNKITGSATGAIVFSAGVDILIRDNTVTSFTAVGINCLTSVAISRVRVYGNYVSSVGSTTHNGGAITCWGSHTYIEGNIIVLGGNSDGGIVILNNDGVGCYDVAIRNNLIENAGTNPFEPIGLGSVKDFVVSGNVCTASVAATVAFIGIEINLCQNGVVANNVVNLGNPTVASSGIFVESSSYVDIIGNLIENWGPAGKAINLLHTNGTGTNNNALSYCLVEANVIKTAAGNTGQCIGLDTLVATGSVSNNKISNNIINGAPGSVGIEVANSAAASSSGMMISGNTILTAATGVLVSSTPQVKVFDNVMSSVATPYNFGSAGNPVFLHEMTAGILFAGIPANLANGSMVYVADGTIANPVAGGGSGCILKRLNGINVGN